ncbi:hypothetical protein ASG29_15420 [Sphingomonas sp. Leaf412]|nr:hypothetical protein ASG29_15420 [Sphingomonas sp. Leaf412]
MTLAGCGAEPPADTARDAVAALDAELTATALANAADPALTAALRDQIMVDPHLVQQANDDSIRPPTTPASGAIPADDIAGAVRRPAMTDALRPAPAASAACPQCAAARASLTLGALAETQGGKAGRCAATVAYSAGWANRLPGGVPLYPDARVAEAAGADGAGCALRIVSFSSAAPMQRLLDYYYTKASAAGYAAGHQADGAEHILGGKRRDGAAFLAVMRARAGGGTEVDLMAEGG